MFLIDYIDEIFIHLEMTDIVVDFTIDYQGEGKYHSIDIVTLCNCLVNTHIQFGSVYECLSYK